MNKHTQPIGIFDSGIGGTSVWKEIHALLPHENTIYLADSKNAPYGIKTKEEITALSCKNVEFLLDKGAKIIVVACNTATMNAIETLRATFDVPFIGMEPAIKPAVALTKTKTIGVLATKGTLTSTKYMEHEHYYPEVHIMDQIGYNLVQLIEEGKLDSEEMTQLLKEYTQPMLDQNMDCLVLGCTHYPYLRPQLQRLLPAYVHIIDSGAAVAKQTKKILEENNWLNTAATPGLCMFHTNSDAAVLKHILGFDKEVYQTSF